MVQQNCDIQRIERIKHDGLVFDYSSIESVIALTQKESFIGTLTDSRDGFVEYT
jgi:hypothetical protein